jgi:hypothetical protein
LRGADAVVLSGAARPTVAGQRRSESVAAGSVPNESGNRGGVTVARFDAGRVVVARFVVVGLSALRFVPLAVAVRFAGVARVTPDFVAGRFGAADFVAVRFGEAGFAAVRLTGAFFASAFRVDAFFATVFAFDTVFFGATFFETAFFDAAFLDVTFLAGTFFDATFFATDFFADFFTAGLLAPVALAVLRATAFLPVVAEATFAFARALPLPAVPRWVLRAVFAVAMRVSSPVVFEVLHFAFMLFRRGARPERAEVAPLVGFRVLLAGIQTELAGCEFANHRSSSGCAESPRRTGCDSCAVQFGCGKKLPATC